MTAGKLIPFYKQIFLLKICCLKAFLEGVNYELKLKFPPSKMKSINIG